MAEGDHITLATTCSLEIMLWPPGNEGPQHAKHSYNVCCYKYTHAAQIAAPSCGMPLCYTCYAWQPRPSLLLLDALHEVIVPLQEVLVRTLFTHGPPPRGDESGLGSNAQVGEAWRSMLVVHRCSMKIQWKQTEGKNSHVAWNIVKILWKYENICFPSWTFGTCFLQVEKHRTYARLSSNIHTARSANQVRNSKVH